MHNVHPGHSPRAKKQIEDTRIVVIDDDRGVLDSIVDALEFTGYQVEGSTKDGEYLNQAFQRGLPDLVILDVFLSGQDGREICSELKSRESTRRIPVILISAHPEAKETAFEAGADDFLAKPFELDALLDTVARAI